LIRIQRCSRSPSPLANPRKRRRQPWQSYAGERWPYTHEPYWPTETHNANRRTQRAQEADSYQRLRGVELRPRSRCCPRRTECDDEKSVEGGGLIPPNDATIGFHGSWRISLTTDKGKTGDLPSNCLWRRLHYLPEPRQATELTTSALFPAARPSSMSGEGIAAPTFIDQGDDE
jgi:hypothetical protein